MASQIGIEKRIIIAATVFVLALTGVIAITVRMFGIGLPTCVTDVAPFREAKVIQHAPGRYEVHYVAKMWAFQPAEIAVEPGSTIDFYLSTPDVMHGMQIIGTNLNLMAVPGVVNYARVKFDKPGEYLVVCNEYCGTAHHNMAGRIRVSAEAVAEAAAAAAARAQSVERLLDQHGCLACHSTDGSESIGPTFKGLFGSTRIMADGSTVIADEAYLREAIDEPEARVVKDFDAMPEMPLPAEDTAAIIEYIRTLR